MRNLQPEPRTQVEIDTFGPDGIRVLEPMSEQAREKIQKAVESGAKAEPVQAQSH